MSVINKTSQLGTSLIETLVALFLLALGLLGVLALQVNSINSSQRALFTSEALLAATDMVDQMYAIRDSAYTGLVTATSIDDATADLENEFDGLDTANAANVAPDCQSAACDLPGQVDLANFDWNESLQTRLPSGRGVIEEAAGVYTITVFWDEAKTGATGLDCSGNSDVDLRCFSVEIQL